MTPRDSQPLHLYVHWPFCRRICPYCDFNVKRWREQDTSHLEQALLRDLAQEATRREGRGILHAIHFGGGSPSMMPASTITAVIARARELFHCAADMEIALEANPEDSQLFEDIAASGINRLTLGAQSLDASRLKTLGRAHSPDQVIEAINKARTLFASLAMDSIFATPRQTLEDWHRELGEIFALPLDHLSLYGLSIEANTAFGRRKPEGLPDEDEQADMLQLNAEMAKKSHFEHYEISNYAKAGHRSRYNSGVWRLEEYIGIGPGAHGRLHENTSRWALRKLPDIDDWQRGILKQKHPHQAHFSAGLEHQERLSPASCVQEWLLMGMRLREGLSLENLPTFLPSKIHTKSLLKVLDSHPDVQELCQMELLLYEPERLATTKKGWLLLDSLCWRLYAALEQNFFLNSQTHDQYT